MNLHNLPDELLVQIVSYSLPWPARLNLRNVDRRHRSIIDSYFSNVGDVDVDCYQHLNKNFDICEQLEYITNDCSKMVGGLSIPESIFYHSGFEEIVKLVVAIGRILDNNADKLETFKLNCLNPFLPPQSTLAIRDAIKQVIARAVNLRNLEIICYSIVNAMSIDLCNQKNLKSLRGGDAFSFKNCPDGLVEFDHADFFTERLTTLSILRRDEFEFQRAFIGSCATLQSISLVNTQFYDASPKVSLKFPSLRYLYVSCSRNLNVEIDISNSTELQEVTMVCSNGVQLAGFNPRMHRFKLLTWYGANLDLPIQLLSNLESRSELEELTITIESFALINMMYTKTLNALACGCPKLKRAVIRATERYLTPDVNLSSLLASNNQLSLARLGDLAIDKRDLVQAVEAKMSAQMDFTLVVGQVNCTRRAFSKELLNALAHRQVKKRDFKFNLIAQWYSGNDSSCLAFMNSSNKVEEKYGIEIQN